MMQTLTIGILILILIIACWQDFHNYHIKNKIVLLGVSLGIVLNSFLPTGIGFFDSVIGLSFGLMLLLPLYLLRIMGAGDVKLMAMVGAFVGQYDIFGVFLSTLIAGGVLALIASLQQGAVRKLIDNVILMFLLALSTEKSDFLKGNFSFSVENKDSIGKLPYAIAITVGTVFFLALKHLQ